MTALKPWSGPALLVPMTLEVLILTDGSDTANWWWNPPDFQNLVSFSSPEAAPFNAQQPQINQGNFTAGAVVYWSLPDGLTRGIQIGNSIQYPAVPNRWLLVRKSIDPSNPTEWQYTAWIIASDYLGDPNGSPFVNPQGTIAQNNVSTTIGKSWPIADWPGERAIANNLLSPPLTAAGVGDPSFAAFVPNVINVFAFPDDLSAVNPGPVSYSVFGWYSDPSNDPLLGVSQFGAGGFQTPEQWEQLTGQLRWSVGGEIALLLADSASEQWAEANGFEIDPSNLQNFYPARTLCHGQIFSVNWPGATGAVQTGIPSGNSQTPGSVNVAIANSAIDALGSLMAQTDDSLTPAQTASMQNILEAFQYGCLPLLEEADAQASLDAQLQNGWFNTARGQTVWSVVTGGSNEPPLLTADQAALLMNLNVAQSALDACVAQTSALQGLLYDVWWKQQALLNQIPPPKDEQKWLAAMAAYQTTLENQIDTQLNLYAFERQQRDTAFVSLSASLDPAMQIKNASGVPFVAPNDPVMLITGAGRSFVHGEDDRFGTGGALFCRLTGQTIDALSLPGGATVTGSDVSLPSWTVSDLPLEIPDLVCEAFFLDVTNAPLIAVAADSANPWPLLTSIEAEQTLIWNPAADGVLSAQTIAEQSGLDSEFGLGALPSKVGVQVWSPPWSPLFLQWGVGFTPGSSSQADAMQPWQFNGGTNAGDALDDFAYRFTGPTPTGNGGVAMVGSTLLTPQASDLLTARLEQLIAEYSNQPSAQPDLWALQDALEYVESADVLAQAMSGFNLQLLQQNTDTFRIPDDGSLDAWLFPPNGPQFQPLATPVPTAPADQFNPIRAGHLQVRQLQVVDAFGQAFDVLAAMNETAANFTPILGPDLETAGSTSLVELKPRVLQFNRFLLDFLDANNDALQVGIAPNANPICGWLIANQLDDSLLVYDAAGDFQGEITSDGGVAVWNPSPLRSLPGGDLTGGVTIIANAHLQAMVNGLLAQPSSGDALDALLDVMRQLSWALAPGGGWADQELPALIGKPLAVVRASAQLELLGPPVTDQLWSDGGAPVTDGFEQVAFTVQLGSSELLDDGVVGYFVNDDYTQMQSVYVPVPSTGYIDEGTFPLSFTDSALVTLIVDASASINAITGIQPPVAFTIPSVLATPALSKMEIVFRTGPIVTDLAAVGMPLPNITDGEWSWLQYQSTTSPAASMGVVAVDQTAVLADTQPVVREGWLALVLDAPPTVLTYSIAPAAVTRGGTEAVTISAFNGSGEAAVIREIVLRLAVGSTAADLTADPSSITPAASRGWTIASHEAGSFRAFPPKPDLLIPAGATITFTLSGIDVNALPGSTDINVIETAAAAHAVSLSLTKLPGS